MPELTKRTRSIDGTSVRTSSASSTSSGLGAPKLVPSLACRASALVEPRRRVAVDHRPPRTDVVDERVAVDVGDAGAVARAMKCGVPPTALKARTGEFTPPGRIVTARAKSFADFRESSWFRDASRVLWSFAMFAEAPRHRSRGLQAGRLAVSLVTTEHSRGVAREIGDDHVGAGAANRGQRFHHRALLVDPAIPRGGLDHRVLAAHLIRGGRIARTAP